MKKGSFKGLLFREFYVARMNYGYNLLAYIILCTLALLTLLSYKCGNLHRYNYLIDDTTKDTINAAIKFGPAYIAACFFSGAADAVPKDEKTGRMRFRTACPAPPLQLAFSVIVFFPGFGEEWGWRGYMMPKLMELMPKPVAVIVGGVIWGLWHAPLTVSGHNFGLDYKFYPWLGILLMCVFCILMNAFLTLLTERTKSVYPAAFCHAVNNNINVSILLGIFGSQAALESLVTVSNISTFWILLPVSGITAIVSMVLLMKKPASE